MRLPEVSRYLADQPKGTASTQADKNSAENPAAAQPTQSGPNHAGSQEAAILSRSMVPSTHDRRVMLIVLAVTAITLILLCWHDSRERTASSPPLPSREDHQSTGNCPAAQGIPGTRPPSCRQTEVGSLTLLFLAVDLSVRTSSN
jgi:hypothetical protein